MQRMKVNTSKKREVVDLTDDLQKIIEKSYTNVSGFCQLSVCLLYTSPSPRD